MQKVSIGNWITIVLILINLAGTTYIAKFKIDLNSAEIKERPTKTEVELMIINKWSELKRDLVNELK